MVVIPIIEKITAMRQLSYLLVLILVSLAARSCYYDNEEWLYPELGSGCDTVNVTFTATIKPMLSSNCFSCHSNSTAPSFGNNIKLENYADVVSSSAAVKGAINHTGGYSPMPKNGGKMSSCILTQFDIWIKNGTPEN